MMETVQFTQAYYIKLGQGGQFADWSIANDRLWFGWDMLSPGEINDAVQSNKQGDGTKWGAILTKLQAAGIGAPLMARNAVKRIAESTSDDDVWITFHNSHLWWCRVVKDSPVVAVNARNFQRGGVGGPKYRATEPWSNQDVCGTPLIINQISGKLSRLQGFRATTCKVGALNELKRLLNNQPSPAYEEVQASRDVLIQKVEAGMKDLFWKDFEILADLVFSGSGWRRVSSVGGPMKDVDMEYISPVSGDLYQVQVKSAATLNDFRRAARRFPKAGFRKLYFVVHSPADGLATAANPHSKIELVLPRRVAEMVVDLGLVDWLLGKIK